MYNIGQVSKMLNLPISTLRYYDKEGLLLNLDRDNSGVRKFNESNIQALKLIECLKKSGMQIKEIKEFIKWCSLGDKTIPKRKNMFLKQKEHIQKQIDELNNIMNTIEFKCWYYNKAEEDGTEEYVRTISVDKMPKDIQKYYNALKKTH